MSGNAAITINANPGDKINIIGVVLDGTAISATTGIFFTAGGILNVKDSVIRNFTQSGINFTPSTSSQSQIFVSNTLVSDNGSDGILINPTGSGTTNGILSRVYVENNGGNGLNFLTSTQTINVTVTDSVSASSSLNGVNAESDGGTAVSIMVRNSTIANNTLEGLQATGTGDTIRVTRSTITGNSSGWGAGSSGVVLSYADNNIDGNGVVNSEPPNALTYK